MKTFKKVVKWVGVVSIFILLFAFTIIANNKRSNSDVSFVDIQFSNPEFKFVGKEDLIQSFEIDDHISLGKTSELNLNEIEDIIQANEYVDKSHAFINNREQLVIEVKQKEPLFRVFHDNGVNYYVDKNGIKFPNSSTFTANVPLATGHIIYETDSLGIQQSKAINDLVTFFEFINDKQSLKAMVSQVDVRRNGDLVFTPRTGKHIVNIGRPINLDDKMDQLTIFYKEGLNKIGWDKYKEINLKYKNQIIAKK